VQGAADREQSERIPRARTLVDDSRIEGHGDGVSFVVGGVVIFSIHLNEDRENRSLAIFGDLEDSECARARVFLSGCLSFPRRNLRAFLLRRDRCDQKTCTGQGRDQSAHAV
jgi:hypothetical protein